MSITELQLSVSRAKTFDQCNRKYYYQYVLKLPTKQRDYNALGSLVHYVLEIAFQDWIRSNYQKDLKSCFTSSWLNAQETQEWKDAIDFNVTEQAKQYVIEYYKSFTAESSSQKPISCEPRFILPLEIGASLRAKVVGYIDRIDRVDYKTLYLLDYKTTNKVQYLDSFQLGIYVAACLAGPYKGYNFKAAYILLRHDMALKNMLSPNKTYKSHVDKMVEIAIRMDEVCKKGQFAPTFTRLCDYCDYQEKCYKETGGPPPKVFKAASINTDSIGEGIW